MQGLADVPPPELSSVPPSVTNEHPPERPVKEAGIASPITPKAASNAVNEAVTAIPLPTNLVINPYPSPARLLAPMPVPTPITTCVQDVAKIQRTKDEEAAAIAQEQQYTQDAIASNKASAQQNGFGNTVLATEGNQQLLQQAKSTEASITKSYEIILGTIQPICTTAMP